MKTTILLVIVLALGSCAPTNGTIPRDALGRPQPIEVDTLSPIIPSACRDSLFLALQTKPWSQLTAYERKYFEQKWDECNGTPDVPHGSAPEWIVATLDIIGFVAAILILLVR